MRVLRVELVAPVCSFRYPHFLVGRQVSFDAPPPSTIFGHVASALGEWPDRASFRFAYRFSVAGKGEDLENQHIILPGGRPFQLEGQRYATSTVATVQPARREILLGARLVLYLDRPEFAQCFRRPRFPVILGRSQDLACYTRVDEVTLQRADRGYFEDTLLPFDFRRRTARGVTVLMPRYVGPPPLRQPVFDRFVVLSGDWVYCRPAGEPSRFGSRELLSLDGEPLELWVDPDSEERDGARLALAFHGFV